MPFRVYHHADPFTHRALPGAADRPHRIAALLDGLAAVDRLTKCDAIEFKVAPTAPLETALLMHNEAYIETLARPFEEGEHFRRLGAVGTTIQASDSFEAALGAVGAACEAVDAIVAGELESALVACRPAGNRARRVDARDGCLLGTAALAAKHAQEKHGMRVAILDFDARFGRGTVDLIGGNPDIFYASTHEDEGPMSREDDAQLMCLPLAATPAGIEGSINMREAWSKITSRLVEFKPDLIVVSAGFGAHEKDCSSKLKWKQDDYRHLGSTIDWLARDLCGCPSIHVLEGGDDLEVLRYTGLSYFGAFFGGKYSTSRTPGSHALPQWIKPEGQAATPYLVGDLKVTHRYSGGFARYGVVKAGGRLWIRDGCTDAMGSSALIHTIPDFLKKRHWRDIDELIERLSGQGVIEIRDIIEFEAQLRKGFRLFRPKRAWQEDFRQ
jgi:acetoin utilization deacetylase AcuC-like enzyme